MTNSGERKLEHLAHGWALEPKPTMSEETYDGIEIKRIGWRGRLIRITGKCPYCLGDFTYDHNLKLVPTVAVPSGQGSGAIDITIKCACEHRHPNAPDSVTGCGQHWTIEIVS